LKSVQPSSKREGFATVPDVTFDDIGALRDVREELSMAILVRLISYLSQLCINNVFLIGIYSSSSSI
jgi:hypothetical protein